MTKSEQRIRAKKIIASLGRDYFAVANKSITNAVIFSENFKSSKNIFVYVSVPNEPDTSAIIKTALEHGKNVFVPKCISDCEMIAVRINNMNELSAGKMGIPEPKAVSETAEPSQIELAVIPCVSASYDGKRLGHGAGYYDRFLQNCNAVKMCLCYEKLIFNDIQTSDFDIIADIVITEK